MGGRADIWKERSRRNERSKRATRATRLATSFRGAFGGNNSLSSLPFAAEGQNALRSARRTMATDPGAAPKVNAWEAPTDIPSWKEEHIVIAVLAGWSVVIFGATKMFGGKKE